MFATDNTVAPAATYQVDLVVQYPSPLEAQKLCPVLLQVTASNFVWPAEEELELEEYEFDSPRFDEDEALGKFKLIGDSEAPDIQSFSTDCSDESWS